MNGTCSGSAVCLDDCEFLIWNDSCFHICCAMSLCMCVFVARSICAKLFGRFAFCVIVIGYPFVRIERMGKAERERMHGSGPHWIKAIGNKM